MITIKVKIFKEIAPLSRVHGAPRNDRWIVTATSPAKRIPRNDRRWKCVSEIIFFTFINYYKIQKII